MTGVQTCALPIYHRKQRGKDSLGTSLDKIEGIGPKTVELLITHFGSVKKVMEAKKEELEKLIGKAKADKILQTIKRTLHF
mgnify:CR=1 FL=1